jgi:hypothetical protein
VPLLELRLDAEPVQHPTQEGRLDPDAEQADPAAGLQPDLVERRGQYIARHVPRAFEALRPRHRGLAARRERLYAEPQLLHRRPRQRPAHLGDQPDHAPVLARLVQGAKSRPQLAPAAGAQPCDRIVGISSDRHFGQVELEQQRWPAAWYRSHMFTMT